MKTIKLSLVVFAAIIIAACGSSKKSTKSTVSTTPAPVTPSTGYITDDYIFTKPSTGIYVPGNDELTAIQPKYPDATLEKLKEGYVIYAEGACIKCHGAKSIYKRDEIQWKHIVDDMAIKARISDAQKDAVYKYVLAIKATQPSDMK
jgi:hypothetical protein